MKKILVLLCLCILCAGFNANALTLTAGNAGNALPGDFITVPVSVSNMTGLDVMAFEFHFCYDPAVLSYDGMTVDIAFPDQNWVLDHTVLSPGEILVIGYGRDAPLVGGGGLVTFSFRVRDAVPWDDCYDYGFGCCAPVFGDGLNVVTVGGQFCVPMHPSTVVRGTVYTKVYRCQNCGVECVEVGVPGITVELYQAPCSECEPEILYTTVTTNQNGDFEIPVFDENDYRLQIVPFAYQGPDLYGQIPTSTINAEDLYYLKRFLLQSESLANCAVPAGSFGECPPTVVLPQMMAADVNFDDHVMVTDAPYLWQLVSNVMTSSYTVMPSSPWSWQVVCGERDLYVAVPESGAGAPMTGNDFFMVLPGDIDGSDALPAEAKTVRSNEVLRAPRLHAPDMAGTGRSCSIMRTTCTACSSS